MQRKSYCVRRSNPDSELRYAPFILRIAKESTLLEWNKVQRINFIVIFSIYLTWEEQHSSESLCCFLEGCYSPNFHLKLAYPTSQENREPIFVRPYWFSRTTLMRSATLLLLEPQNQRFLY